MLPTETLIGETNSGMSYIQNESPDELVQGVFNLKYLVPEFSIIYTPKMYLFKYINTSSKSDSLIAIFYSLSCIV